MENGCFNPSLDDYYSFFSSGGYVETKIKEKKFRISSLESGTGTTGLLCVSNNRRTQHLQTGQGAQAGQGRARGKTSLHITIIYRSVELEGGQDILVSSTFRFTFSSFEYQASIGSNSTWGC